MCGAAAEAWITDTATSRGGRESERTSEVAHFDGMLEVRDFALRAARAVVDRHLRHGVRA